MTENGAPHPAIVISGLTKRYNSFAALDNLHLAINSGEVLGFLGLNGAGKTTTIRLLLDLLRPTGGKACIFGRDCQANGWEVRALVGYLPGELGIYSDMTGLEVLDFLAGLNRQPVDPQYRRELQQRLELDDDQLRRKLREFSTGMKRKLGIIQAMQADPPLLILDEPTEGLDPLMQESFYGLIADVRGRGRTVFMSSHVLSEVERVCDRIALLRKGELVLLAAVEEVRKLAARRVRITFADDVELNCALPPGHVVIEVQPRSWILKVEGTLGPLLAQLASLPVKDIQTHEARLEDVLIKYYREDAR